jgi:peptidoglycan hydrolase-like protein with peptidoglycan-binding domain
VRRRRVLLGAGAASVVLVAGGAAIVVRDEGGGASGDPSASTAAGAATAEVTRRDLEEREELDGTLGYGDTSQVSLSGAGTITALPALGSVIDRGQTVAEVDGLAVPLLFGDRPLWRQLDANATGGADIQELEANLVALGFANSDSLTIDQDWTSATTAAVKAWQESLGREKTGVAGPADVVVLPGSVRVSAHPTPVGSPGGGPVLEVTATTRLVSIDLDATKQSLVSVGQAVEVVLPDTTTTTGRITSVGSVAEAGQDDDGDGSPDSSTIEVLVALDDPSAGGSLDQAPVTVRVVTTAAQGVLAVPVSALLALADGSSVVERVESDGTTSQVPVETGAFADGWVEVTGDLAEGDDVVVPE